MNQLYGCSIIWWLFNKIYFKNNKSLEKFKIRFKIFKSSKKLINISKKIYLLNLILRFSEKFLLKNEIKIQNLSLTAKHIISSFKVSIFSLKNFIK